VNLLKRLLCSHKKATYTVTGRWRKTTFCVFCGKKLVVEHLSPEQVLDNNAEYEYGQYVKYNSQKHRCQVTGKIEEIRWIVEPVENRGISYTVTGLFGTETVKQEDIIRGWK